MRVDFYQLGEMTAAQALPQIAGKCLAAGERLLVVAAEAEARTALSAALWNAPGAFLANGERGGAHEARQLILLAADAGPAANGARCCALADGMWRDVDFARTFLLFGAGGLDGARAAWRALGTRDGIERRFWKREAGRWVEGP